MLLGIRPRAVAPVRSKPVLSSVTVPELRVHALPLQQLDMCAGLAENHTAFVVLSENKNHVRVHNRPQPMSIEQISHLYISQGQCCRDVRNNNLRRFWQPSLNAALYLSFSL